MSVPFGVPVVILRGRGANQDLSRSADDEPAAAGHAARRAADGARRTSARPDHGRDRCVAVRLFSRRSTAEPGIDWARVELFHLDEYVGLPIDHPASFRKYLLERLIGKTGIARYHLLDGETDRARRRRARRTRARRAAPVDVAFVGIGENGHLAFNDPPADFDTERPYLDRRRWTRPAAGSRSAKAGLRRWRTCRAGDLDVGAADSRSRARSSASCRTRGRRAAVKACVEGDDLADGAGVDPPDAREHDALSRRGIGGAAAIRRLRGEMLANGDA